MNDTPLPPIDDDRTDAERAYFESGGSKAEGLAPALPAAEPETKPTVQASPADKPDAVQPDEQVDEVEEIVRGQKTQKMVNYGALHKERELRKASDAEKAELRKTLSDLQEKFARGDERLRLLTEALTPQQQAEERQEVREDPRPDPEKDVFAYMAWQDRRAERLEKALVETRQESNAFVQHYQGQQAANQLVTTYRQDANNFSRENPDFAAAYQFILADRDRELQQMGYDDPNQRLQIITNEERDLVERNLKARKSPAAAIYSLAKGRGYKTPEPAKPEAQNGVGQQAQQAPGSLASAQAPSGPSVTEEIARLQQAQNASKSLSSAGSSPNAPFSMKSLSEMPDDEFEAMVKKHGGLQKLMELAAA